MWTQTTNLFTIPGPDTFKVPAGVTSLTVECWGAGGAGGGATAAISVFGGGGGGGGAYNRITLVSTPATILNYNVGAGGIGANGADGPNGGATNFSTVIANAGSGGTNGNTYDDNFDGFSIDGNTYIDFYSINAADHLAIQGRALPFTDTDLVPLGYRSAIAGSFTIAINQADGVLANQRIYLEDKQTGTINELTAQNYTFNTAVGTFDNRFVLRYTIKTLGTDDFETVENQITVVSQDKAILISSPTENLSKVFIYDVSGKQLYKKQNVGNLELSIQHLTFVQQVLLVKVVLKNGYTITKKLIFK